METEIPFYKFHSIAVELGKWSLNFFRSRKFSVSCSEAFPTFSRRSGQNEKILCALASVHRAFGVSGASAIFSEESGIITQLPAHQHILSMSKLLRSLGRNYANRQSSSPYASGRLNSRRSSRLLSCRREPSTSSAGAINHCGKLEEESVLMQKKQTLLKSVNKHAKERREWQ